MPEADKNTPKILSKNLFPVVGIGASAGGLEAFRKFINAIPDHSGIAYILVQHLHPDHPSSLPEILQRETNIPVLEIKDNVEVKPDNIYIIPANKMLVATDGILQLSPRSTKDRINMPINIFFSSLAEVHQSHAIGIVLSGTGMDGTIGLEDIKNLGGITFAQEINTAGYEDMPQNAIDAGVVDFILPPEKMPQQLLSLQQTNNIQDKEIENSTDDQTNEKIFKKIVILLRLRHNVDFTYYKQATIRRRMLRRMMITKNENLADYLQYLKQNNNEIDILFHDVLISVTSFFRDSAVFENLCETVFPELIKNKENNNSLRIWTAACSTGEEAFSMAICLHEYLSVKTTNIKIQIFATDISARAIAKARKGLYSKREVEGVSESRLHQFFTKTDGHYQVKKPIRDMCVFAVHDFLKDPPFAKIDLISCRNVLIYLEPFLQKKALTGFHYALNEKGYLLLGKSETTGSSSELFQTLRKDEKLYSRNSVPGRFMNVASQLREDAVKDNDYSIRSNERKKDDFQKNADDVLLSKYSPVGVIVNEQLDIVQFRGATGEFLEPAPGKASLNVLKMVREGLSFELRNALHQSKTTNKPFIKEGIRINYGKKLVTLEVIPLLNTEDLYFLILFKENSGVSKPEADSNPQPKAGNISTEEKEIRIQQLEKNLLQAREDMRGITEDQEATNEELQSANEELLSGSEELQSLNEELETSKEELQSINEELITVNQELYERNEQYNLSRLYAEAIVSTINEPLIVLDRQFRIKSANNAFYKTFDIIEEETIGKVLFDLQNEGWNIPGVNYQLLKIQKEEEKVVEWEQIYRFPAVGERAICFTAKPFQKENGEHWILLALEDITQKKLLENRSLLSTIVDNSNDAIMSKKLDGTILSWNKSAENTFGYKAEEIIGKNILLIIPPELKHEEKMIISKIKKGEAIPHFNTVRVAKDGKRVNVSVTISPIKDAEGIIVGASKISRDITEQILTHKKIEASEAENKDLLNRFKILVEQAPVAIAILTGSDYIVEIANDYYLQLVGKGKDFIGKPILETLAEVRDQGIKDLLDNVMQTGNPYYGNEVELYIHRNNKKDQVFVNFVYQPIRDIDDKITGIIVVATEVTEQVLSRKAVEASEKRYDKMVMQSPFGFALLKGENLEIKLANDSIKEMWGKEKNVEGKLFFDLLPEIKDQGFAELLQTVFKTGKPYYANERLAQMLRNGKMEDVYFNFVYQPNLEADGTITGVTIIAMEVTSQALFNQKIKASEEQFRLLTELVPEKISNADVAGNIIYFNQKWLDYTGMSFEELRDFGYHKIMHPEEIDDFQNRLQKAAEMGLGLEMEMRFMNKEGHYKWHLNRTTPVKDETGKVSMWIGATTDIQDQKLKEQAKDEFIGVASHEMKTPLTTAKAYIQMLQQNISQSRQSDNNTPVDEEIEVQNLFLARKANDSIDRLNRLIGELLDVTKIKNGKLPLIISTFNFNEMVNSAVESVSYQSPNHTIIKSGEIEELVNGDKERLQQVVINLLSNAVKYSPKGDKVYINIVKENHQIKVSVKDDGIGINKENLQKIFERYYREQHRTTQFQGLGIGLSISAEIIERHHGQIWAESEPGNGSTFYFIIPIENDKLQDIN